MELATFTLFLALFQSGLAAPSSNLSLGIFGLGQTSLPQYDINATRRLGIAVKRTGYQYGPPPLGATFYPNGTVADVRNGADIANFLLDAAVIEAALALDTTFAEGNLTLYGGFHNISTYAQQLYSKQWALSNPMGEDRGILSNFTEDLQFSMERLSLNPFAVHRLGPSDSLPFEVDASEVTQITGSSLQELQGQGRLFYVDHSYQAKYPSDPTKYGAACTAYFFISSDEDFLPLAIKTNTGSDLTYTPLDSANDWLLAKIMFNVNDGFDSAGFHFAATHNVVEAVHEAAVRTLSDDHPVLAVLDRLMVGAYAIEPVGSDVVFNKGGPFDKVFYTDSDGIRQFFKDSYFGGSGDFQAGYLETRLSGLLGENVTGPALKNFPFYEDASKLRDVIKTFMTTFITTYYASDAILAADNEAQSWFNETTFSGTINFPCSANASCTRADLIQILTHFAYMTGVQHHALNTGDLASSDGTLPFHPAALYAPLPTSKNVGDLLPFLPNVTAAMDHVNLINGFNRPQYESQKRTLAYAYSEPLFLARFTPAIATAAEKYNTDMLAISRDIRARSFDGEGLSQGMPFIYRNLDPNVIPWFVAV